MHVGGGLDLWRENFSLGLDTVRCGLQQSGPVPKHAMGAIRQLGSAALGIQGAEPPTSPQFTPCCCQSAIIAGVTSRWNCSP